MLTGIFSVRTRKFNSHFDGIGERLRTMSELFEAAFNGDKGSVRTTLRSIKEEEDVLLSIITSLRNDTGNTLLSPLDREDIHFLTSDLKLLAGNMLHITAQLKNLSSTRLPATIYTIVPMIAAAIAELARVLGMLKNISKLKDLTDLCRSVRQTLYKCDTLIDDATAEALNTVKEPFELIKITDLFSALQRLLEKAGDMVDNSETIIIKYS